MPAGPLQVRLFCAVLLSHPDVVWFTIAGLLCMHYSIPIHASHTRGAAIQDVSTKTTGLPVLQVIGFDMGGTSTDVSRYDGVMQHVLESTTAGVTIQAPQLDINTVAAGGGSRLFYRGGIFVVGPESAGAHPGPVCYRKPGGCLAVTDANAVLGRVLPEYFPKIFGPNEDEPLDVQGVCADGMVCTATLRLRCSMKADRLAFLLRSEC